MFWNLLSAANSSGASGSGSNPASGAFLVIMIVIFVLFMFWNRKTQKKREKEITDKLNAIQPGDKVMTIGYLCGTVVEICPEENALVIETGSETAGKSYVKMDRRAVFQTNAATVEAPVEEITKEETAQLDEVFAEENPQESTEE